jgi:hypothetical protein
MELIDRSEVVDRHGIDCLAKPLDAVADRSNQIAVRVVVGNILLSRHRPPPERRSMINVSAIASVVSHAHDRSASP